MPGAPSCRSTIAEVHQRRGHPMPTPPRRPGPASRRGGGRRQGAIVSGPRAGEARTPVARCRAARRRPRPARPARRSGQCCGRSGGRRERSGGRSRRGRPRTEHARTRGWGEAERLSGRRALTVATEPGPRPRTVDIATGRSRRCCRLEDTHPLHLRPELRGRPETKEVRAKHRRPDPTGHALQGRYRTTAGVRTSSSV
jgi:hypothetical protein